ncbi:hypothetical protein [Nonomuraea sp. NPDC050783]|uniref:hypothetical protein n=1 Tax=Nonomuraea sp. NPDC050783 TaxID=3154634 RepID=UPI003465381D
MGHGGPAERATVPAYMLHRLPAAVSLEQAAVFEPAAVALHAVRRAGIRPGESVAVLGLGPIGLLVVQLAARHGTEHVEAAGRTRAVAGGVDGPGNEPPGNGPREIKVRSGCRGGADTLRTRDDQAHRGAGHAQED